MTDTDLRGQVALAARVLARHGLVTAFGHVSARVGRQVVVTPPIPPGDVTAEMLVTVDVAADELPDGAAPETWAHLAVYRARPDVAAVVRAQPESAFAAAAVTTELAPLHGQAAWLGRRVPVHPVGRLLRTPALAAAAAATLADADAVLLRANGALTVGDTPGVAVARMWLLDAACRVHLAAGPAARVLDDDDVDAWRAAGPPLLDRLWRHLAGLP
ncbi:class II aldolase/adducin family protein [Actinomycetospora termitidis]|uniref:Class II aldolase/adducin family protein n=1 Tax=Actinomycetospora termitidis TaxID=3053470 RepID=A0ABT7MI30_9PSEU|nr:class II aldolase/adducin family protein [Actinomycetospora sp. Odt1-22]MDL5160343.1 class II aldolase/adducin family protein [Actinomycetospora sp. Odt1-22]